MVELILDKQLDYQWTFSKERALSIWLLQMIAQYTDALRVIQNNIWIVFMIIVDLFTGLDVIHLIVIFSSLAVQIGHANYGTLKTLRNLILYVLF